MGNSAERIPIRDLGDVIYYKQVKEYADVEFEISKDLDREIKKGRIIVLEKNAAIRGSDMVPGHTTAAPPVNMEDLKAAIREALPSSDVAGAVKDLLPSIAEMIRQEIAKVSIQQNVYGGGPAVPAPAFTQYKDAVYVPTISAEGMVSNVEIKKTETSGTSTGDALAALRGMKK